MNGTARVSERRRLLTRAVLFRPSNMSISQLPALNAILNSVSAILLITGYLFIRQKKIKAHRASMIIAIVPMVFVTFSRALKKRFDLHRKIARWTLPIWLYVSVTGVIVYLMLYQLY